MDPSTTFVPISERLHAFASVFGTHMDVVDGITPVQPLRVPGTRLALPIRGRGSESGLSGPVSSEAGGIATTNTRRHVSNLVPEGDMSVGPRGGVPKSVNCRRVCPEPPSARFRALSLPHPIPGYDIDMLPSFCMDPSSILRARRPQTPPQTVFGGGITIPTHSPGGLTDSPASITRSVDSESIASHRSSHSPWNSKSSLSSVDLDELLEEGNAFCTAKPSNLKLSARFLPRSSPKRSPLASKDNKYSSKLCVESVLEDRVPGVDL